jgi:hypothetical protein
VILTTKEIHLILRSINVEIVVDRSDDFPYRIVRDGFGYHPNTEIGALQAKLSIMLEMASRADKKFVVDHRAPRGERILDEIANDPSVSPDVRKLADETLKDIKCPKCDGTGTEKDYTGPRGIMALRVGCAGCGGSGKKR